MPLTALDNGWVWDEVAPRLEALVREGRFTLGDELRQFEAAVADATGCRWAVGVSSGTAALALALRAAPVRPRARVAIPANTFFATFEAVVHAGMVPVVVDHDDDYLIDLNALEAAAVDAVIAVHLYGLPVDMPALMSCAGRHGWWVLEDCSQAHGAVVDGRPVGSFGHAAAFSAYPTKNLGAWGDGGYITGLDEDLRRAVMALRHHGQDEPNVHSVLGGTERLDNLQALVLGTKLTRLGEEVDARRRVAARYRDTLAGLGLALPGDRESRKHAYHQFVVRVHDRDRVRSRLAEAGVQTGVHYPVPIHRQPAATAVHEIVGPTHRADTWCGEILSLPMFASLSDDDINHVAGSLKRALHGSRRDRQRVHSRGAGQRRRV